nr:hypothetical protein [Conexibacter sp. W3-3-2]
MEAEVLLAVDDPHQQLRGNRLDRRRGERLERRDDREHRRRVLPEAC